MKLNDAVPDALLEPAAPELIELAERELGLVFPTALRAIYLECNGMREPLGQAHYVGRFSVKRRLSG
jgi:hypothetical protein